MRRGVCLYTVRKLEYKIEQEWAGRTVKEFLQHIGCSSAVITGLKNNPKGILVGTKRVTVRKQLKAGEVLSLRIRNRPEDEAGDRIVPMDLPFGILYEDEDILVVDKPAGMPTHPVMNHHNDTLANAVVYHWQQIKRPQLYRPISRLDKDTTGALVIAKHALAAARLSEDLKKRTLKREYLALCVGKLQGEGTVDMPIDRVPDSVIKRRIISKAEETDKTRAVTHYNVVCSGETVSLVRLSLETGKTHQIRVHMAHLGHPLLGDWLYGKECEEIARPALHSLSLSLTHPVTEQPMQFSAPIPEDMRNLLQQFDMGDMKL